MEITDGEDLLSMLESIYPNKKELLEKLEEYFRKMNRHDVVRVLERCSELKCHINSGFVSLVICMKCD